MAYTAVDDAGSFYNTKLYTGTGSSLAVTGVGFQPDFTWIKNRDAADFHVLTDAVRGATKYIQSNSTAAAVTDTETLKSFDSGGFTVGTTAQVNTSTEDYASWNWKAGTTSVPSGGSITPSAVSLNATSGFSMIAYTGTGDTSNTIAHGLGAVPKMMFFKNREEVMAWVVYHQALGNTDYLVLDTTDATASSTTRWNDTTPTSTLLTIGNTDKINSVDIDYMGYVFADVQGYSKAFGYTGNGSTDGTFVYTGFSPAYILLKNADQGDGWNIYDIKRDPLNPTTIQLQPDTTAAESTVVNWKMDILSNGFKLLANSSESNGAGILYVGMAFAEAPFVNSSGVPVNAR